MAPASSLLLFVTLLIFAAPSLAKKFTVGGSNHWAPNVNYTTWADQKQFHVGDWLDFKYQRDMYDVVQVSDEAAYKACNDSAAIVRYSRGTNFAFELNHTGRYYFICSRGYCWNGMKVSVLVHPAPAPSPAASHHASSSCARGEAGAWLAALSASLGAAALLSLPFRV
ncbi:hypothetical protein PR202_gb04655 [Eleusine coracana subsp. coracana]|uniref:Phytocyanin domain-containing protein n=1 Tax=Eleusine coracana subsp. coracana TaxID=191504 RepID=A0AAV5E589_ELECO|nr:hypothetical protein QOZ80_1BG0084350 [Eleusine coracana subsp. coracana]GJN17577.1 hypothetical protein PR202_gb04655 [Eleusine coracana subsp. coracana]